MTEKTVVLKPSVRKANFGDLEALHSLDNRLFPPGVCFDMGMFYFHFVDPATSIFLAEEEGALAGFVIFRCESPKVGDIVTIDVEPEFQGQGIGSKLMDIVDQMASFNGLETIVLQVSAENNLAQKFYEKHGFVTTRLLKGYYQGGEDAWEMRRKLERQPG